MRDSHRMVLQHFMCKGLLNRDEMCKIYSQSRRKSQEEFDEANFEELKNFINTINQNIKPFNLEIKKGFEEHDGTSFYSLVNTIESPISRLSSIYTPNEMELFKKLVEYIVEAEDGKIGSRVALNLTERLEKKMGKEDAQNFFNKLEKEKWIHTGEDGKIVLSGRTIVELDQYLQEMYPDFINKCYLCDKICLMSETCANCGIKLHVRCSRNFFERSQQDKCCPARDCGAPWGQVCL